MKIYHAKDYAHMCCKAADIIAAQVTLKPDCVLGLATGATPEGIYNRLAEMHKESGLDFSGVSTVNLDEYRGLCRDDPQSYYYYMDKHLFSRVNIDVGRTHLPNGLAEDSLTECSQYDRVIAELGGIDLQLLGIGVNGHIGFNEPDKEFKNGTHLVGLSASTIEANSRYFASADKVPKSAYTMGMGAIMRAHCVLLTASGKSKAEALYKALTGPVTPELPASILQLHRNVIVVADREALEMF